MPDPLEANPHYQEIPSSATLPLHVLLAQVCRLQSHTKSNPLTNGNSDNRIQSCQCVPSLISQYQVLPVFLFLTLPLGKRSIVGIPTSNSRS